MKYLGNQPLKRMQKLSFLPSIMHEFYRGIPRGKLFTALSLLLHKGSFKTFLSSTASSGGTWLHEVWYKNTSLALLTLCSWWELWTEKASATVTLHKFSSSCSDKLPPQLLCQILKSICITEEMVMVKFLTFTMFWLSLKPV